ncbi:hypothetical protein V5799_020038 [Amblyomma americanum]|uniref:Secreted protein n=1 Tax=Amblyomma americanum TaxID=6943 RepID=A0AAQ4EV72_AMBAM
MNVKVTLLGLALFALLASECRAAIVFETGDEGRAVGQEVDRHSREVQDVEGRILITTDQAEARAATKEIDRHGGGVEDVEGRIPSNCVKSLCG